MRLTVAQALERLSEEKRLFATLFTHGTLEIELYRPMRVDLQQPHTRDEVYVVARGRGRFICDGAAEPVTAGDVLFVPAATEHRFIDFTDDFCTWVLFYGPEGGEAASALERTG